MNSVFDLTGKCAVVTGGNKGIGLGMAQGLSNAGASVSIWGRDERANEAAAEALSGGGGGIQTQAVDVSDEYAVGKAFARTVDCFGHVDVVVANAGKGPSPVPFDQIATEDWHRMFSVNVDGVFWTLRAAVRHLRERGAGGSLIVTSSIAADMGYPRGQHYSATKSALRGLIQSLAVDYGRYGIRANAIAPGWVQTDMTSQAMASSEFEGAVLPRVPLGRWGTPDDFGGIAVYLASDAARWHTGDTITVDGGYRRM